MIRQDEIKEYLDKEAAFDEASQEYSEGRTNLISRLSRGEKIQTGKFVLKFKPFDRTNTQWAEVIKKLMAVVEHKIEVTQSPKIRKWAIRLQDKYDFYRGRFSKTSKQVRLQVKVRRMKQVYVEEKV